MGENLMVVETFKSCTCNSYYGAHEAHCGMEPVGYAEEILTASVMWDFSNALGLELM